VWPGRRTQPGQDLVERLGLLEVPEVVGPEDDLELGPGYARRQCLGQGDVGAILRSAEYERRHRHPIRPGAQIEAGDRP
jgi:hypothetical protein